MAEYIDREAAMTAILNVPDGNWKSERYANEIKAIPTADAEPVKHGRWEYHLMPLAFKCSSCGYKATAKEWKFHAMWYCPACGCRMENGRN